MQFIRAAVSLWSQSSFHLQEMLLLRFGLSWSRSLTNFLCHLPKYPWVWQGHRIYHIIYYIDALFVADQPPIYLFSVFWSILNNSNSFIIGTYVAYSCVFTRFIVPDMCFLLSKWHLQLIRNWWVIFIAFIPLRHLWRYLFMTVITVVYMAHSGSDSQYFFSPRILILTFHYYEN